MSVNEFASSQSCVSITLTVTILALTENWLNSCILTEELSSHSVSNCRITSQSHFLSFSNSCVCLCALYSLECFSHVEALLHVIVVGSVSVDVSHSAVTPIHPAVLLQSLIYKDTNVPVSVNVIVLHISSKCHLLFIFRDRTLTQRCLLGQVKRPPTHNSI